MSDLQDSDIVNWYSHIHKWMRKTYGKASKCEHCDSTTAKRFEWSNISGNYLKDRTDWQELCPSCHRKYDYTDKLRAHLSDIRRGVPKPHLRKPVTSIDKEGHIVHYESLKAAAKETGIDMKRISNIVRGDRKTAGGLQWIYKN